jgi:hypothetical protein
MAKMKNKNNKEIGFSIMEVVAAIGIFTVVFVSVFGSFKAGLTSLVQSRHRTEAAALANEKMEIIRNLSYSSVGTIGGIPTGSLPQNESVTKSNQKFNVHTFIRYVDDASDGVGADDQNHVTTDYKEVKVEVVWGGVSTGHGVAAVSKFVPNGVETDIGGGTFRLNVLDGSGAGLSGVAAHITNSSANPAVDISTNTDSYGTVLMSGMPAGDRNYHISVSKDGYESVSTSPPYPTTTYDPTDVHASVYENDLNTKAIIIDKQSSLNIFARDILDYDHLFPNTDFNLKGGRVIGLEFGTTNEITNYDQNMATGAAGDVSVSELSPGKYNITLNEPGYALVGTDPVLPVALAPDQNTQVNLILANSSVNSLLVTVKDSKSGMPIANATVHLSNTTGMDISLITGEKGQVYFPPNTDPPTALVGGIYTLEVSASGYGVFSEEITVNQLIQKETQLDPNS